MKVLWLFGLSIGLGQALIVHVDVKVGQGSGAPVWEYPDWEGYPCHLEGQSGCPGYVITGKVWGESQNCDKIGSHAHRLSWGYPPHKLNDFGYFVEMHGQPRVWPTKLQCDRGYQKQQNWLGHSYVQSEVLQRWHTSLHPQAANSSLGSGAWAIQGRMVGVEACSPRTLGRYIFDIDISCFYYIFLSRLIFSTRAQKSPKPSALHTLNPSECRSKTELYEMWSTAWHPREKPSKIATVCLFAIF